MKCRLCDNEATLIRRHQWGWIDLDCGEHNSFYRNTPGVPLDSVQGQQWLADKVVQLLNDPEDDIPF